MSQLNEDFYEKYGKEWVSEKRKQVEKMTTQYKIDNLLPLLNGLRVDKIIDYGCGLGDALNILSNRLVPTEVIGIDISQSMIEYAKKEYSMYKFKVGDYKILAEYNVDLITFIDVLEHLEDIPTVLNLAKSSTKYIAIKIPLEKTWLINLLNRLNLKPNQSRLFESEGHLYEFNRRDFNKILKQCDLNILKSTTNFVPKNIHFSNYMKSRMKSKLGIIGKLKYYLYQLFSKMPYVLTRPIFKIANGVDYFIVCKT